MYKVDTDVPLPLRVTTTSLSIERGRNERIQVFMGITIQCVGFFYACIIGGVTGSLHVTSIVHTCQLVPSAAVQPTAITIALGN